ncbi:MAG: ATP-binding protein [Deltaproteobacteria bacterium]|nr:ATP-binding protein [Deltaproteobacteria bacterium]
MFDRVLLPHLQRGRRSVLLLGPRQVGKSTLLRSLRPDWIIDLASPASFRDYVAHPERLEAELRGAARTVRSVLIDEVQRVPALLDVLQAVIDSTPGRFRFLLSGSSARRLRGGRANLLPGRLHVHYLHPLLACELAGAFSLDRALAHGTLPGIYSEPDPDTRAADLRTYGDTYLREEIQAEALARDLGGYARLLDLVAASSGTILNLRGLCGQAGLAYETARRYVEILEDTLVVFRVPAWSGSDRASLVAHPKLYLFDLGVRNALLRRPLDRPLDDERGLLVEHFVGAELHRRTGTLWPEARVWHFRTSHGAEVDFVLEVGRELWGIEVKASRNTAGRRAGFDALAQRTTRLARRIVVFLGPRRQRLGDVEALPLEAFLDELPR